MVGEDWEEDESQDVRFDDILSNIARDVASRAPPTPRQVCHTLLYAVGGDGRLSTYDNRELVAHCGFGVLDSTHGKQNHMHFVATTRRA